MMTEAHQEIETAYNDVFAFIDMLFENRADKLRRRDRQRIETVAFRQENWLRNLPLEHGLSGLSSFSD